MKAIKLFEPGNLRLIEVPVPKPDHGEILVQVEAAGICGTDRHLFKGEYPSTPGSTLGHEFTGVVVDCGSAVTIPIGTRVTCDPNIWCGECEHCRRGRVNLCSRNVAIGIQRDGGFAEYCAFPAHKAHCLPSELDPHHGALCEPLACTIHGLDIAAPQFGERVIVIGGGVIGLLAVQLAKRAGTEVMLLTRNSSKRELALKLGADTVARSEEEARQQWPKGADIVLECAGVDDTMDMSPRLTRNGGRVVILGVLAKGHRIEIEPFDLLTREVQVQFSFLNPFTQERAAQMIAERKIEIEPLITSRIPIAKAVDAITSPAANGEIRTLIVPKL